MTLTRPSPGGGVALWPKHDLAARATMVCGAWQGAGQDRKGRGYETTREETTGIRRWTDRSVRDGGHADRDRHPRRDTGVGCSDVSVHDPWLDHDPLLRPRHHTDHHRPGWHDAERLGAHDHPRTPYGQASLSVLSSASGGSVMNVEKLTIVGPSTNSTCNTSAGTNSPAFLRGVEFLDASGLVKKVTITGINKGAGNTCTEGNAIVANDETGLINLTVEHNTVSGSQGLGVYVQGDATANISHNTFSQAPATGDGNAIGIRIISAHGATISHDSVSTASNAYAAIDIQRTNGVAISHVTLRSPGTTQGIYENDLSGGSISHSTVTAGSSSFAAVNLTETTGVTVSHNTAHGALVIYTNCAILPNASNNTLTHNTVQGAAFGIQITADPTGRAPARRRPMTTP